MNQRTLATTTRGRCIIQAAEVVLWVTACCGPTVTAAGDHVIVRDDFEQTSCWKLHTRRGAGTQGLCTTGAHTGRGFLESVVSRGTLTASRPVHLTVRHTLVRFWYRPCFDARRLTDVVLTVGAVSQTDRAVYTVSLHDLEADKWQLFECELGRLSTRLVGDRVREIQVSLSSYSGPLRLGLDDFEILQPAGKDAAPVDPSPRSESAVRYRFPSACTPRLHKALVNKLRAVMARDVSSFPQLAACGANAVVIPARPDAELFTLISQAHRYDLAVLAAFPLFKTHPETVTTDSESAGLPDTVGIDSEVVCPFDWKNWHDTVRPQFQRLMAVAAAVPVDAVLFDLHLYGSLLPTLATGPCCFCARCFDTYTRARDLPPPGLTRSAAGRFAWICKGCLWEDYCRFQGQRLQRRVQELVDDSAAASPSVLIGVLDYEPHWTGDGVVKGILAARGSALVLFRAPCGKGYTLETDRTVDHVRRFGSAVIGVPGMSPVEVGGVRRLPLELFHTALNSAGYWVSLARQVREGQAQRFPFANPSRDLLSGCKWTNDALTEWMKGNS